MRLRKQKVLVYSSVLGNFACIIYDLTNIFLSAGLANSFCNTAHAKKKHSYAALGWCCERGQSHKFLTVEPQQRPYDLFR